MSTRCAVPILVGASPRCIGLYDIVLAPRAGRHICDSDAVTWFDEILDACERFSDDGVVVVPRANAGNVVAASRAREERETMVRKRYSSGELGLDINNMRPRLAEKGLVYVDQADLDKN